MGTTEQPGPRYDSDLQMFCEALREPDVAKLRFLRWLAERGQLEHEVFGPPIGSYAEDGTAGAPAAQDSPIARDHDDASKEDQR